MRTIPGLSRVISPVGVSLFLQLLSLFVTLFPLPQTIVRRAEGHGGIGNRPLAIAAPRSRRDTGAGTPITVSMHQVLG